MQMQSRMPQLELRLLVGHSFEMQDLQRVLLSAPKYTEAVTGHPPGMAEAQSTFTALPPGKEYSDKFVLGIYLADRMIGCADIIRGYPDSGTAHIGLLLFTEKFQGKGYGSKALPLIEE